ncbi:DNA repair protein RecO [Myroides sp. 1354]|uniref:DNA repair protein RecO n=1 Tax=unclassified Myroides TaxID=2642485 RepID=UPI0025750AB8|nr:MULTISPECIES: DNA repair protein RecO [unclassified Myroides]MDM1043546.1 DNA repair protein RecO [Myroides sp. R163-1]MDM1054404.1 DNA repair protein RecO [Myroides sp. 1354]MDM1067700.1 DNA repair protein RecO [Myroides sp. 1372]
MVIQTKAIVLQAIKYQDKSLIVKCLTKEVGIQTFFVRNAFAKGKSAQKIAYFQPLMLLDISFTFKNKGGMEYFKEIRVDQVYHSIYYDFSKNSIALFVSEMLSMIVSEQERDEQFYSFIETALLWLDTHDETANFHLLLLVELTKYLGFYPDVSEADCHYFDWYEGVFTDIHVAHCFDAEETFLFKRLLELGFESDQKVFSSRDRKTLLALLMKYYEVHFTAFKKPKSLEILKEVFA